MREDPCPVCGRRSGEAILPGDKVAGETVAGFAFVPSGEVPSATDDHLLICGEENRPWPPPYRPVPLADDRGPVERLGCLPQAHLPEGGNLPVADVSPQLPELIEQLIVNSEDPITRFFKHLFTEVAREGYQIWVVGGAVRDLLTDGKAAKVNDLDFCGTAPPGLMASLAGRALARVGMGHQRPRVSRGLVCSVRFPDRQERILEYKALALTTFGFPATGGDMVMDATTRDLTVNTIMYDRGLMIFDPTSRGLKDLSAQPRRLASPYSHGDPVEQACIILRALKFTLRWEDVDGAAFSEWMSTLPADLIARIPETGWRQLARKRRDCVDGAPYERQAKAAGKLGDAAVRLLAELDVRDERMNAGS